MKQIGVFSTAILLFAFLGATALAQAQQDQQGEKQGKQEEKDKSEQRQQDKNRPRDQQQQPAKPQQPQRDQQPPQQDQSKPAQQQEQPGKPQRPQHDQQPPQQDQNKPAQQQQPAKQQQPQSDQQPQQQDQNRRRTQQQQQPDQREQPQRDQQLQQQDRNSQRAEHQRQQPAQVQHQEERTTQLRSTPQQQRVWQQEQQRTWQQHRARSFEAEHRSWKQRGGYNGYRIPDNDFHSHYGRDHSFRVFSLPFLVVGGSPRFQYGGYWFSPAEPYPEYWGTDWYQNDDVCVDYTDDGYYLYNRRFPSRAGIAISISSQQDQYPNQRYYRDQVPGGSYTQTCQNVQVSGNTLYATCEMANGGGRDTALRNFDQCNGEITNVDGELECVSSQDQYPKRRYYRDRVPGGSYTQTCQNVQVRGNALYATCEMANGELRDTVLRNFDQCSGEITNVNGELQCR